MTTGLASCSGDTMDDQALIETVLEAKANEEQQQRLRDTSQLTLGELTAQVEAAVDGRGLPTIFDSGAHYPAGLGSWRGSYSELAIRWTTDPEEGLTGAALLDVLQQADGGEFTGYKGGQFEMGPTTPVWVANRGTSDGFVDTELMEHQAVSGVSAGEGGIVIQTTAVEY